MKKRYIFGSAALALLATITLAACGSKTSSSGTGKNIKATITFVDQKTDMHSNGMWKEYIAQFNKEYPNITVKEQALNNYDQTEQTRMSSKNFGDVIAIPAAVAPKDYPNFFSSLGKTKDLEKKYTSLQDRTYKGEQYGLPSEVNANGFVVNWNVFKKAGIDKWPTTTDEFIQDLKTIKTKEPDVTPLYTNYACGWALVDWDFQRSPVAGDPNFDLALAKTDKPFTAGQPMYTIYNTLYTAAKDGLINHDPTTDDWNTSVSQMAQNKVGVMMLATWAVPQVQAQMSSNKDAINVEPFPQKAPDGKTYMLVGGDYNWGVNKNSKNQEAAKDWVNWLVDKSDFAKDNGGMTAMKNQPYPADLNDAKKNKVVFFEAGSTPADKADLFSNINNGSQVGIGTTQTVKQQIIDSGDGSSNKSFASIMDGLNTAWAQNVKQYNPDKK